MDPQGLVNTMVGAGQALGADVWSGISTYAVPELKKIAIQIEAIAAHLDDYTEDGARALFKMQVDASIGVIVAMTQLTLLAVQKMINTILSAIRNEVNGALGFALLV